ncbi:StbA protein [Clostridium saccharoperbutylacetonicum]|uniref:ParM/StbA family protein n=1 Tax=Clostridium saccharoperbutylacetonicum TaxID=36745 RepID=UPI0039E9CFD1
MKLKILGLDNGYKQTKTSKKISICSTIERRVDDINDVLQVKIGDENYVVGEPDGNYIADADKLKTEENRENLKACTLTAIGLSYPTETFIDASLVVGLPVGFFTQQKEEFKNMMESLSEKIYINKLGIEQTIKVKQVLVYPQSAGLIFKKAQKSESIKSETSLVIDVGGGTWDVSQFDGLKLVKKATYQNGMLILHSQIAQELNSKHYTKFKTSNIYDLIKRGYFTVEGEKKSMAEVDHFRNDHVSEAAINIKRDFDVNNVDNIYLIGGGADEVKQFLDKYINNIELEKDAQFVNAECFELMGKIKLEQ